MLCFRILYYVSELCRSNRSKAFFMRGFGCAFFIFRRNGMKKLSLLLIFLLLLLFCGCVQSGVSENVVTPGMEKALSSAKFHLSSAAYSKKALAALLEESGYSSEEALYAVENCGADWNEEALKTAKELLSFSSFSKEALVFQLEIKGFTHEEALFGAEKNGY